MKSLRCTYCGGYPGKSKLMDGFLYLQEEGINFRVFLNQFTVPYSEIRTTGIIYLDETSSTISSTGIALGVETNLWIPENSTTETPYFAINFQSNNIDYRTLFRPIKDNAYGWKQITNMIKSLDERIHA
ncbi:hypothetical protein M2145_001010 [Lachnospiraceae bacterium PF1-21]|uniref:hypothetical protein n=1 Tax=Ohessyouella blattaphilus TaxID=2949333 RepID=UPI003E299694